MRVRRAAWPAVDRPEMDRPEMDRPEMDRPDMDLPYIDRDRHWLRISHGWPRPAASGKRQDHRCPRVRKRNQYVPHRADADFVSGTRVHAAHHYHILNTPGEAVDATLLGTVVSASSTPLTYNSATGQAASVLVVVSMRVTLTDRQGKVLYQNPSYLFREQYEVSQDLASFFEEDSPAFRRLSQDFARTLVSNILEGF